MRAQRAGIAVLIVVGLSAAPVAHAASPRPACDLVTDAAGDVTPSPPGADSGDFDLRSADVATDAHKLTAVIRLTSLAPEDPASVASRDYEFDFVANGHSFGLQATLLTGGANFEAVEYGPATAGGRSGTDLGDISGVVDTARHEIRMTAPLKLFAPYATFKQTYIDQLSVLSGQAVGYGRTAVGHAVSVGSQAISFVVDTATSTSRYSPGRRSCVRVGH